jgi:hypothetical protein
VQNGNIDEAAQCKIHIAFLIAQYLQHQAPKQLPKELRSKQHNELFSRIAPSIYHEVKLIDQIVRYKCAVSYKPAKRR